MTINITWKKHLSLESKEKNPPQNESLTNVFSEVSPIQPTLKRGVKRRRVWDDHQRNVAPRRLSLPKKTKPIRTHRKPKRRNKLSTRFKRTHHLRLAHNRVRTVPKEEIMDYLNRVKISRNAKDESDIVPPSHLEKEVANWINSPSLSPSSSSIPPSLHIELFSNHFTLQAAGSSVNRSLPYNDATRDFLKAVDEGRLIPDVLAELPDRTNTYFEKGSIIVDVVDRRKIEQAERKRRHETTGDKSGFRFGDDEDDYQGAPTHRKVRLTPDMYTLHTDVTQFIDDNMAIKGITPSPMDRIRILQRILEVHCPHLCTDPSPDVYRAANGIVSASQRAILRPPRRPRHSGLPTALLSGPATPRTDHTLLNFLVRNGWSTPQSKPSTTSEHRHTAMSQSSNTAMGSNVLSPMQQALLWQKKFKIHLSTAVDRYKELCVETEDRQTKELLVVRPGPTRGQYEAFIRTKTGTTSESIRRIHLGSCSSAEHFFTMYRWLRSRAGYRILQDRTHIVDRQKQQQQQQQQQQQIQFQQQQQQQQPSAMFLGAANQRTVQQRGMPSGFNPNQQQNK